MSSGGEQLALETDQRSIVLIDLQTGRLIHTISLIDQPASFSAEGIMRINSSGQTLFINSPLDGAIGLWNLQTGKLIRELDTAGVLLSSDGKILTIETQENPTLIRLDALTGRQIQSFPFPRKVEDLGSYRVSADGRILLTASDSTRTNEGLLFMVWDVETGTKIGEFRQAAPRTLPLPIALSPDGKWMASVDSAQLQLRNLETGKIVRFTQSLPADVLFLLFSLDGKTLVAFCQNRTIVVRSISQ